MLPSPGSNLSQEEIDYYVNLAFAANKLADILKHPLEEFGTAKLLTEMANIEDIRNPKYLPFGNNVGRTRAQSESRTKIPIPELSRGESLITGAHDEMIRGLGVEGVCDCAPGQRIAVAVATMIQAVQPAEGSDLFVIRVPSLEDASIADWDRKLRGGIQLISGVLKMDPTAFQTTSEEGNGLTYASIGERIRRTPRWVKDRKTELGPADRPGKGRTPHTWSQTNPDIIAFIQNHKPL